LSDCRRLRVVHVPNSVGGNPQGLSAQLRALGIDSEVWALAGNPFGYLADRTLWAPGDGLLLREWKRLRAIWAVAREFDVIHFNFGTTLSEPLPMRRDGDLGLVRKLKTLMNALYRRALFGIEIMLYRLHGRAMFMHYQGDDARQGDVSLARSKYSIAHQVGGGYYCRPTDAFKRGMIGTMAQVCVQVYAVNPDLLHVLRPGARFIPYCHIQLDEWSPRFIDPAGAPPLRIGHAPSHRGVKGSDLILAALERLRLDGYVFDVDLIEGVSQDVARKRFAKVDVVVDQLHAGWYGGVAVEAMALGKPVLVYIREDDLRFIPDQMRSDLPFIQVTPDTIEDGLRRALTMSRGELLGLAIRSRAYVERWHDPAMIAAEILQDYRVALSCRKDQGCAA
jgi:glycosyltransferase involved in cell wall biosynthesis